MIYKLVYPVWLITFCLGFYTAEVATDVWGFPGRLAAYVTWVFGAMVTAFGVPLLLHNLWGDQLEFELKFAIGALVGTVFNILFFIAGLRLKVAKRMAWQKKWQQFNDEANRPT